MVHRHLPGRYYSEPNGEAILLGRVDLRVDHGQFGNHMKIQDAPRADNPVRLSRAAPDDTEVVPPKSRKQIQRSQLTFLFQRT